MSGQKGVSRNKQKVSINCECDFILSGNSPAHAKALLKEHRKSKQHKRRLKLKQDISNGEIKDISGADFKKVKEGVN